MSSLAWQLGLRRRRDGGGADIFARFEVRVAVAFEQALAKFQPEPFDGPVHLLLSAEFRALNRWRNSEPIRKIFAGPLEIRDVFSSHGEIFGRRAKQGLRSEVARSLREILALTASSETSPRSTIRD